MDEVIGHTRQGVLRGERKSGCRVFRGVPFAQPPVGPRRFMPPEPPDSWTGVRDATSFGPVAMQIPTVLETERGLPTDMSEDCLSLNIWTADMSEHSAKALPVMVWIHGGAFINGSGAIPWYDGSSLAARGDVVVVTANYRLGVFGFLSLAEVGGEKYASSGNLGLLDQIAVLSWVQENVAAFGGDPNRVCVVGESAGAMSIGTLLSIPAAQGLFRRAILQSGTPVAQPALSAARTSTELFTELHIDRDKAGLARLNAMTAEEILSAAGQVALRKLTTSTSDDGAFPWSPVIDGVVLHGVPMEAESGPTVPVLIGTNRDEMRIIRRLFPERPPLDLSQLEDQVAAICGPFCPDVLNWYRKRDPGATPDDLWDAIASDRIFGLPAADFIDHRVKKKEFTWTYLFSWASAAHGGTYGAAHTVEIPFVFGTFDAPGAMDFLGRPRSEMDGLAARVQQAWVSFARDGIPSVDGLPDWPPCDSRTRPTMVFDVECVLKEDPIGRVRALWKRCV
jgi:para-nitrobenzyl esterase